LIKYFKLIIFMNLIFILGFMTPPGDSTLPTLLPEKILDVIAGEVSGEICFENLRQLTTWHRIWGSKEYNQAALFLTKKAKEYGLEEITIENYPIRTGDETFWMQTTGGILPWDCRAASLEMIEPYRMVLSDYEGIPSSVVISSSPTDVTSEVVYIGDGSVEDIFNEKRVKGKIVLAEGGNFNQIVNLAIYKFGAIGILHYYNFSGPNQVEDAVYWHLLPAISPDKKKCFTFGFSLSAHQGNLLKRLLEKGERLIIKTQIDADIVKERGFELATAAIMGSEYPDEEFIFYAHLDHPKPGAHDNGSGDVVLLEVARTLSSLVRKGLIPPPKRTIRFLWIPHMMGLNMYLYNHQEKLGKIKAGVNLDCVAVDQKRFNSQFWVSLPPHSLPTWLTDLSCNLVEHFNSRIENAIFDPLGDTPRSLSLFKAQGGNSGPFFARITPYKGVSDEYAANVSSINIPSIYFHNYPLPPRHSQINFLNYIDRTNLKRVAFLGAIISYAFSHIGPTESPQLINEIFNGAKIRLLEELHQGKYLVHKDITNNYWKAKNLLQRGLKRERKCLESTILFTKENQDATEYLNTTKQKLNSFGQELLKELEEYYLQKCVQLNKKAQKVPALTAEEKRLQKIIPIPNPQVKGVPGYLKGYFRLALGEEGLKAFPNTLARSYNYGVLGYYETISFIDGERSILDIYNAVQAELLSGNYPPSQGISLTETEEYIRMLEAAKVIFIKNK